MTQAQLNHKAIITYGMSASSTQEKINEAIIKSENLVNVSATDQSEVNRRFFLAQNISPELLPS